MRLTYRSSLKVRFLLNEEPFTWYFPIFELNS